MTMMMILALQPHMHQEEIMLGDNQEHHLQAVVRVGKKKYPQKPCRVYAAHKKHQDTGYICKEHAKSSCIKDIASRGTTPE
jgi:hypothetical protein